MLPRFLIPYLQIGHGLFNLSLFAIFVYQGRLGWLIRRNRQAGSPPEVAKVRRHRALGPILAECFDAALTEKCRMIWISLPGTRDGFQTPAGPGIFAVAGPGIADGPIQEEFGPDDVTPTLLWLLGLPAARDMPGRARTEILAPGAADPLLPIRWISGYGRREVDEIEKGDGKLDQETLERFRSLGYIDG